MDKHIMYIILNNSFIVCFFSVLYNYVYSVYTFNVLSPTLSENELYTDNIYIYIYIYIYMIYIYDFLSTNSK